MKHAAAFLVALLSVAAAPQAVATPSSFRPAQAVARTHVCNYYPDAARRGNESGKTLIHYDVDATGRIVNVSVAKSSGYPLLDQTAVACVAQDWRDLPAMQGGVPVASPGHLAAIQFRLQNNPGFALPTPLTVIFLLLSALIAAIVVAIGFYHDRRSTPAP
jgi:TonB family protein